MRRSVLAIVGMRCNACRERVTDVLGGLTGVLDVQVSLVRGCAIVTHAAGCSPAALVAAVVGLGFGAELVPDIE